MEKNLEVYDFWNEEKKKIEYLGSLKQVRSGEIWMCKIGLNIGSEISKGIPFTRPVLVLKTGLGGDLVFVVPFSTKAHSYFSRFEVIFDNYKSYGLDYPSFLLLNQCRIISHKRLVRKINAINTITFGRIPLVPQSILNEISSIIISTLFS